MLPSADHLYGCDFRWWTHWIETVTRDYDGVCWTQNVQWEKKGEKVNPEQWGITQLTSLDLPGLSREKGTIHRGGNSGYQAVNLAYLLGAERIILLGFDMMMQGNKRHFFGDHPGSMNAGSNYTNFIQSFGSIVPKEYGIEIFNCSRRTALNCFPKYNLEDLYARFNSGNRIESIADRPFNTELLRVNFRL